MSCRHYGVHDWKQVEAVNHAPDFGRDVAMGNRL